jgi:hypothetical protein
MRCLKTFFEPLLVKEGKPLILARARLTLLHPVKFTLEHQVHTLMLTLHVVGAFAFSIISIKIIKMFV